MERRIKHIALQFLLPLIIIFQFGQANFLHFHVSDDGRVVAHSHPYQIQDNEEEGKPSPGHHHSNSELLTLQFFDGSFSDDVAVFDYDLFGDSESTKYKSLYSANYISENSKNQFYLRGPPTS